MDIRYKLKGRRKYQHDEKEMMRILHNNPGIKEVTINFVGRGYQYTHTKTRAAFFAHCKKNESVNIA